MDVSMIEKLLKNKDFQIILKEMFKKDYTDKSVFESLCDLTNVTDVKSILMYEHYYDDGNMFSTNLFIDEKDNIRLSELCDDLIFGYIEYFNLHNTIKQDLINSINSSFDFEKYGA